MVGTSSVIPPLPKSVESSVADPVQTKKSVRLLTLNSWGLKFISKFRKQRLQAIADRIAQQHEKYDIVVFQEVWVQEDWDYLVEKCKSSFPFQRIFRSGIISGPGLALISKIPIESTFLYRFPINGRPSAFYRGDWYVGKGIAVTFLQPHEEGAIPIAILNSHMHAPYASDKYSCHRACQAWDMMKIITLIRNAGYATIVVGDLNSRPGSLPYRLFTVESGLADSWELFKHDNHNDDNITTQKDIALMSPEEQVTEAGVTCDSILNTWRANRRVDEACRLDYAFIDATKMTTINAEVQFTEKLPAPLNCSYSDHFAYYVEFIISPDSRYTELKTPTDRINLLKEFFNEIEEYQRTVIPKQIAWRKWHFFIGVSILFSSAFAIPFLRKISTFWATILWYTKISICISSLLNGMIWYLGVRSEQRALEEVQLEVQDSFVSVKRNM